ncbi:MAG: N-acetylmuramoyl-L-alanine amidase [Deltaproteobacteria bacterium]|nr:N-acetylmuramoyl-L-alanine amidase [Deltaproteobacteria bacterium]
MRCVRIFKRSLLCGLLAAIFCFSLPFAETAQGKVAIQDIRHWSSPDSISIVADVSGNFSSAVQEDGRRLIVSFPQAQIGKSLPRVKELNAEPVRAILLKQQRDASVEMEIILSRPVRFKFFTLPPIAGKPHRLVVVVDTDIVALEAEASAPPSLPPPSIFPPALDAESPAPPADRGKRGAREKEQAKWVVVIDAGHGGEDPGAIGRRGTKEKTLTLDISKRIAGLLNQKPQYQAYLTRSGDYYVSFRNRISLARGKNAHLFISIHVDAAYSRRAKGASVYALSLKGASNEAARILARNENLADMVGGVDKSEMMDESDAIVLSMFQTRTINQSLTFGKEILQALGNVCKLKYKNPHTARFQVLMLPDVPSLLVEMGFISHPEEEAKLRQASYRQKQAEAVVKGIEAFRLKHSR